MFPFGILIAPLPIVAAALFSGNNGSSNKDGTLKWLQAAKVVFMIHLWAMVTSLLPFLQLPLVTPVLLTSAWAAVVICFLLIVYSILWSSSSDCGLELLKSVMIVAASIGLSLMSVINFSPAQIGAMLIVPMCLLVKPARKQTQGVFVKALILTSNLALLVVGFPPAALLITKAVFGASGKIDIGDFWEWAQILWSWNTATYMYQLWIHLPCWVLCLNIFLYPCIGSPSKA